MTNLARFTINGTPSEDSNGARGYDASVGQTIELQLEQAIGVLAVTFYVPDPAAADAPPSSTGAPQLEFTSNNSNRVTFGSGGSSVLDIATIEIPMSADLDSYVLRATVVTARGEESFDRMLAVRKNGLRKTSVAESTEYSQPGWEVVLNDLIDAFAGAGATAPGYAQPGDPTDDDKVATASGGAMVWAFVSDENVDAAADIAVVKLAAGSDGQVLETVGVTPTWVNKTPASIFPTGRVLYVDGSYAGANGTATGSESQPFTTLADAVAAAVAADIDDSWTLVFAPGTYDGGTLPAMALEIRSSGTAQGAVIFEIPPAETNAIEVDLDPANPNGGASLLTLRDVRVVGPIRAVNGSGGDSLVGVWLFVDLICAVGGVFSDLYSVASVGKPAVSATFVGTTFGSCEVVTANISGGGANPAESGGRVSAIGTIFGLLAAHEIGHVEHCLVRDQVLAARPADEPEVGHVGFFDCTFDPTPGANVFTVAGPPGTVFRMDRVTRYAVSAAGWSLSDPANYPTEIIESGGYPPGAMRLLYVDQQAGPGGDGSPASPFDDAYEAVSLIAASADRTWGVIFAPGAYLRSGPLSVPMRHIEFRSTIIDPDFQEFTFNDAVVLDTDPANLPLWSSPFGSFTFRGLSLLSTVSDVANTDTPGDPGVLYDIAFHDSQFVTFDATESKSCNSVILDSSNDSQPLCENIILPQTWDPGDGDGRVSARGVVIQALSATRVGRIESCEFSGGAILVAFDDGAPNTTPFQDPRRGFFDCAFSSRGDLDKTYYGPAAMRLDRTSLYSFEADGWTVDSAASQLIVESFSGGLTPPVHPADNLRMAIALNGDLYYDPNTLVAPGAIALKTNAGGDTLQTVIARSYDATYGNGVLLGPSAPWADLSSTVTRVSAASTVQFATTVAGAHPAVPVGALGFDSDASQRGIILTTFGGRRVFLARSTFSNDVLLCARSGAVFVQPQTSWKVAPTNGLFDTTQTQDGLSVEWNSGLVNPAVYVDDGVGFFFACSGLSITVPSTNFRGTTCRFKSPNTPNLFTERTPYTASDNARVTWRETSNDNGGEGQVYHREGNLLIGEGSGRYTATSDGVRIADIHRHFELDLSGIVPGTNLEIGRVELSDTKMFDSTSDIMLGIEVRYVIVGLSAPIFVIQRTAVLWRDASNTFIKNTTVTAFDSDSFGAGRFDITLDGSDTIQFTVDVSDAGWDGARVYAHVHLTQARAEAVQ